MTISSIGHSEYPLRVYFDHKTMQFLPILVLPLQQSIHILPAAHHGRSAVHALMHGNSASPDDLFCEQLLVPGSGQHNMFHHAAIEVMNFSHGTSFCVQVRSLMKRRLGLH